jgi:hypothetical protein
MLICSVVPRKNKSSSVAVTFERNFAFLDLEVNGIVIHFKITPTIIFTML